MSEPVSQEITNLQNGVSQQSPSLRFRSQCESQENCRNDPVDGMGKRYNSELRGMLAGLTNPETATYTTVERDEVEKYKMVINAGAVQVFDAKTGYEYPVNVVGAAGSYLSITGNTEAHKAFQFLNTIDVTYVLNKTVPVLRDATPASPEAAPDALRYIKQSDYATTYEVTINGTVCSIETPEATTTEARAGLDTMFLTGEMLTAINTTNATHGCTATQHGNVLYIKRDDDADFTIKANDDLGDRASYALKGWANNMDQVPPNGVEGFRLEIRGEASDTEVDPYHVVYTELDADGNATSGVWKETLKAGVLDSFDLSTMPHSLRRTQDAGNITAGNPLGITFVFEQTNFKTRTVGDDDTAPYPTFVSKYSDQGAVISNRYVKAMAFHEGRLCFVSDENLIFSETGEYNNFFPTTVVTTLAADPIDVALNTNFVAPVEHLLRHAGELFLFSERSQLIVRSGDVFSAETIDIDVLSDYKIDTAVEPFIHEGSIHFWGKGDKYATLYEYIPQGDSNRYVALPITAHVPKYIEGKLVKSLSIQSEGVMFHLTRTLDNSLVNHLYVTNITMQGAERVQNAWQRWTFTGAVIDIALVGSKLSLLMEHTDGVSLEEITLSHDPLSEELGHPVFLDRREEVDANFTLPVGDTRVIYKDGARYWTGFRYDQRFVFSEFFTRDQNGKAITSGRLQLHYLTLSFTDSTTFTVSVSRGADTRVKKFEGVTVGSLQYLLGEVPVTSDTFRVPIHTKSNRAVVTISNDSEHDALFTAAEWQGTYNRVTRRM